MDKMASHYVPLKAGLVRAAQSENTKTCLTFEDRPSTPEKIAKYRKSYFAEPGKRIVHSGMIDDLKKVDPYQKFGVNLVQSDHVQDVTPQFRPSDHTLLTLEKKEAVYASTKREPLGKGYVRGHVLPKTCLDSKFAFGKMEAESASAKGLIYPMVKEDMEKYKEMYQKSHGTSDPGVQKNRMYDWNTIDPNLHKFGVKHKAGVKQGVAKCLNPQMDPEYRSSTIAPKQVEDRKDTNDQIGKSKHLGHGRTHLPDDFTFGVGGSTNEYGAQRCIQGEYSEQEQQPDDDLGKAVTRGWRNVTSDQRAFGVPSVRGDIAAPMRRSVADNQNYGDDVNAEFLLYPDQFAGNGISDESFTQPKDYEELVTMFKGIGYDFSDEVFRNIDQRARNQTQYTALGDVSIEEFRNVLNDYLDALDEGRAW